MFGALVKKDPYKTLEDLRENVALNQRGHFVNTFRTTYFVLNAYGDVIFELIMLKSPIKNFV